MESSFQAGVDTLYNKCVNCGSTPSSKTPTAISNSIQSIYTNRYNTGYNSGHSAGYNSGYSAGKSSVKSNYNLVLKAHTTYDGYTRDNNFTITISSGSASGSGNVRVSHKGVTYETKITVVSLTSV